MNDTRRKEIKTLIERAEAIREELDGLRTDIEAVKDEEEEYRDNIPENLQQSDTYYKAESNCEALNEAYDAADNIDSELDTIVSSLETATEK